MHTLEYTFTFANVDNPHPFIPHSRTRGSSIHHDNAPSVLDPSMTDADSAADDRSRTEPSITTATEYTYGTSLTSNEIAGTDTDMTDRDEDDDDPDAGDDPDAVSNRDDLDDLQFDLDHLTSDQDLSDALRHSRRPHARNTHRRRRRPRATADEASNHTITRSFLLESSSVHAERAQREEELAAWETEVHIPSYHYATEALDIRVTDGDWRYVREKQTLYYRHSNVEPGAVHVIKIAVAKQPHGSLDLDPKTKTQQTKQHSRCMSKDNNRKMSPTPVPVARMERSFSGDTTSPASVLTLQGVV
ncbi:hypothetical protein BC937DRAFT_86954, partial [Endogone sp. FLAS-F59071]